MELGDNEPIAKRIKADADPYERFRISLGYTVGNLLFISGQASTDEHGNVVGEGDFDAQADRVFLKLRRVLEAAGSSTANIIKVTIYLTDMSNFPKIVALRGQHFTEPWPADTIIGVTALALPGLMIEIEAIALLHGEMVG